jgi:TonB-dependent SusC/RagA subfamily outer membrane receptor
MSAAQRHGHGPRHRPDPARSWVRLARWLPLLALALPAAVHAQGEVAGTVVEAVTGRPIPGAQVVVEGTELGSATDAQGRFRIANVAGERAVLRVVMIGYREAAQPVEVGRTDLVLELREAAVALDAIVVTGTVGETQARALGNAVSTISASQRAEVAPVTDVHGLLLGTVPGVRMLKSAGEIGSGGVIRIRGASSMSLSGEPLLYVDGIRVNNDPADGGGVGSDAGQPPSRINDLNPEDIESVEIIKGPAAATLYGTEASNGVIQIITKRGRAGAATVNLHIKQGAAWLPDPESLFPPTYYRSRTGDIVEFNVLRSERERGLGPWFRTGTPQSYGANVSGGSEQVRYYFSLDYDRDEGPVTYNWQNKLSGRGNLSYTPTDNLDLNLSIGTVRSRTRFASANQPITTSIIWSCPAPGCEAGSGAPNAVDGPFRGFIGYLPERFENGDVQGYEDVDRTTIGVTATHRPAGWFTHKVAVGGDFGMARGTELFRRLADDQLGLQVRVGRKDVENRRASFMNADYSATATLNPHENLQFATSGGLQYYERSRDVVFARGETFPVSQLETISSGATRTATEDFVENKTVGLYVQEQVSWKNRIFLTGALRGDDNSAFGKNYDFVVYPKFQASWVVSEEPFFAGIPFDQLKLRAAWGEAGQQPDAFAALRTYEPEAGPGGVPTLTPENIGNPDLEPEVSREFELGFDASVFDGRLGIEFTYYDQQTTNAIVDLPALRSLGFPGNQSLNLGEVANKGIELGVDAAVYRSNAVGIELGLTYSRNDNEVVDIGGGTPIVVSAQNGQMHVPGFSMGSIFQKRVVSSTLTQNDAGRTVATDVMCEGGALLPGTTNLSRGGGAPLPCAEAPNVYWGQPLPVWEGGVTATVTLFRNLQLYALADYVGGHHYINGDIWGAHMLFGNSREILERDDPILLGYETIGGAAALQVGIMEAGVSRLRALSATYTLPSSWVSRFGVSRASLTVLGENLATFWEAQPEAFGIEQIDPEVRNNAGNNGISAFNQEGWPMLRRFSTTLRVTF